MAPVREAWTDERLDDLNAQVGNMGRKMDEGFKRLDAKIDSRIDRLDAKIEGLDARIDSKIEGLRGEMDSKFDGMRAENRAEFASIHSEFAALNRLIIQVGGGVIATVIASMIVERL